MTDQSVKPRYVIYYRLTYHEKLVWSYPRTKAEADRLFMSATFFTKHQVKYNWVSPAHVRCWIEDFDDGQIR